jgi:phosphate transport system substrate-binding protein
MALVAAALTVSLMMAPVTPAQEGTATADLAGLAGTVTADGSATIGPALQAAAAAFAAEAPGVEVRVDLTSSGTGIGRFCAGEIDLATSGRTIGAEEAATCAENGVAYDGFEVAYDGIAVVAHPANGFVDCLTVDQLKRLWEPNAAVADWRDLDPAWPAEPIALHGRGADSGTFLFFTQAVVGEEGAARADYAVHDSHQAVADAVAGEEGGLGFLPFPRYAERQDDLKLVAVDGGAGCVAPSPDTIRDGSYAPLSRPLFVYLKRASLERPEVAEFLRFYFADAARFAEEVGVVASAEDVYAANEVELLAAIAGTDESDGPATVGGTPAP